MHAGPPTRAELRKRLHDLLEGRVSREEVAEWAGGWVGADDPRVDDSTVWQALERLSGADMKTGPEEYLHSEPDFHAWLDALEDAEA
jgi:hypothetical protein